MMKRKKKATKLLRSESEFLRDAPSEIQAILAWFHDGAERARLSDDMEHFAGGFLAALYDDGALFPMSKNAAWLLAMVLTQHQRNPTQPIAWLNLGLALRRMALLSAIIMIGARVELWELELEDGETGMGNVFGQGSL
jgi:hypothetical protein